MVFWLEFSVSSANSRVRDQELFIALSLWGLLRSQGQVISFETTHVVPDRMLGLPYVPHVDTLYLWVWGTQIFQSLTEIAKKRFELYMCHLPLEVHWSHQCHIQTGRNPVQQWRPWKPRSRWSVGNETQGWETQGNFSYLPSCQCAAWTSDSLYRLVLAPWYSFTVYPMLPTGLIHTRMQEPFIKGPILIKLRKVWDNFFQERNQTSFSIHIFKIQNQVWRLELLLTKGNHRDKNSQFISFGEVKKTPVTKR